MVRNALVGIAGTYFAAAELSKKGYIALPTTRNTAGIDILVSNPTNYKTANIQVKTTMKKDYWMLRKKDEESTKSLIYVFVDLRKNPPTYYAVPGSRVAKSIRERHRRWLARKGIKRSRKKDDLRKFHVEEAKNYKNKWNLLKIGQPY